MLALSKLLCTESGQERIDPELGNYENDGAVRIALLFVAITVRKLMRLTPFLSL